MPLGPRDSRSSPFRIMYSTNRIRQFSFQERRDPAMSRSDYMERLAKDLKEYYGYLRELIDVFLLVSC